MSGIDVSLFLQADRPLIQRVISIGHAHLTPRDFTDSGGILHIGTHVRMLLVREEGFEPVMKELEGLTVQLNELLRTGATDGFRQGVKDLWLSRGNVEQFVTAAVYSSTKGRVFPEPFERPNAFGGEPWRGYAILTLPLRTDALHAFIERTLAPFYTGDYRRHDDVPLSEILRLAREVHWKTE